ncbi:MAG: RNA polymerase subunit sigma-24 [Deltaproteobacteria bacterium]|nr:MAG: RNA polymerase subunit sigma-24 [Deltaproteobacteria bacterium]
MSLYNKLLTRVRLCRIFKRYQTFSLVTDLTDNKLYDSDSELAVKARGGDHAAFEELLEKYQGPIYAFALNFFREPTVAEDIAQETFLRAYRFLGSYDPSRKFITWLYSIARNLCIDKHRERSRREQINIEDVPHKLLATDGYGANPIAELEAKEAREILLQAIETLPEKYKTPLLLCYIDGLPYKEVSEILGVSLNNTKVRIFRAKKMLLKILGFSE